jgi:prepilin-type N-terminal cleavage/methylation domain-containing protein
MNFSLDSPGFTLLEVLITLTIVSVLTAIALPQYNDYKRQAFDMRALSDLRNVAISEEAYFMQTERYISCVGITCKSLPGMSTISKGVVLRVQAQNQTFLADASHPLGSGKTFRWDSSNGGLVE